MVAPIEIRPLLPSDWADIRRIYEEGIASGDATFERSAPPWQQWDASHLAFARFAAQAHGSVLGWAALTGVSDRCVYSGVAEVSVYVAAAARGRGVGRVLLLALIDESERSGIWTLQAGIFPENRASVALHLSCGFREVGRRARLGKLGDAWRDVLLLERRSAVTGI